MSESGLRFHKRAAKNIKLGDLVDIMSQYGWGEPVAAPVEKITHRRDGYIVIRVAKKDPHPDFPVTTSQMVTQADRTIIVGPRVMVHVWE